MRAALTSLVAGALLSGCGASLTLPPITGSTAEAPLNQSSSQPTAAPPTATPQAAILTPSGSTPTVDGSTIAIYDLVARGALTCWFGPGAPLKGSHIFHADVPSPTEERDVDITIHERDTTGQPNPRGIRAFRINLSAEAEARTRVTMQVGKLPADLSAAMEKDVVTWAHGREGCQAQVVRPPPPAPEATPTKAKKSKVRKT